MIPEAAHKPANQWLINVSAPEDPCPRGLESELYRIGRLIGSGCYDELVRDGVIVPVPGAKSE